MRKIYLVLLCALIFAEAVMLYGLYDQYETLAAEKNAVERRAGVLKTLLEQTEKELTAGQEKWQAEKRALLDVRNGEPAKSAEINAGTASVSASLPDYSVLLQGLYTQFCVGAEGALGEMRSIFQESRSETSVTSSPSPSSVPAETLDIFAETLPVQRISPVIRQIIKD